MAEELSPIDKRRAERVTANFAVTFREMTAEEAAALEFSEGDLPVSVPPAPAHANPAGPAGAAALAGHTENLSQGGLSLTGDLQILGDRSLERGKKLWVEFSLPGEPAPIRSAAVVAWSLQGTGNRGKFTAGLMFLGIGSEDLEKISRYVAKQH